MLSIPTSINFFLNTLPGFIVFTVYVYILFIWGEIYMKEQHNKNYSKKLDYANYGLNIFIYCFVGINYLLNFILAYDSGDRTVSIPASINSLIIISFACGLYLFSIVLPLTLFVLGYLYFTTPIKSNNLLTHHPSLAQKRNLKRIGTIAIFCIVVYFFRGAITFADVLLTGLSGYWWVDGVYFFLLEVFPLAVVLGSFVGYRGAPDDEHRALLGGHADRPTSDDER